MMSEVAPAIAPASVFKKTEAVTAGTPEAQTAVTTALKVIATYIPTEVLTLYVAVLAAIRVPNQTGQQTLADKRPLEIVFYVFLAATPLIVWLVYAAKCKGGGKPLPWAFRSWPLWEMAGATVAYAAWAFSLSENPFVFASWYSSAVAAIVVLIVSTVLGLLAPLFQRPLNP